MTTSDLEEDRREVVDRYFARVPDDSEKSQVLMHILGGIGVVVAGVLLGATLSWLVGVTVLLLGLGLFFRGVRRYETFREACELALPKARDVVIDHIRERELSKVEERALHRLDLTAEDLELDSVPRDPLAEPTLDGRSARRPLIVTGPVPTSRAMIGRDGVWRFSQYAVLVICPTDYHLGLYRCVIDLRVAGLFQEETHEYHYTDVVAVSTAVQGGPRIVAQSAEAEDSTLRFDSPLLHEFQLVVSSGDRSRIVVGISDERNPDQRARLPVTDIDLVLVAVRAMLRDKKAA
ncbi:hypothetical protein ACGFMK_07330 [Amycolatopsis sp. NPDC049252]|uniref:hypothetical protein n=1 Tax=Amycolatopsis sp. NPDC049252 TaxID=3363933 RepID=UPI003715AC8E